MKAALIGLALTALSLPSAAKPANGPGDSFEVFWTGFRQAVLQNDMRRLTGLTRLPLQVGFEADQDHVKTVSRTALPAFLGAELRCRSADGNTNAAMIRRKVQPAGRFDFHDNSRATVGVFSFARTTDGWRLTLLNLGDIGEYQSLTQGRCS